MGSDSKLDAPIAQYRLAERRATPATLTGDTGRPTLASAVETKLSTPGIESCSPTSNPTRQVIPASTKKANLFNALIVHLQG